MNGAGTRLMVVLTTTAALIVATVVVTARAIAGSDRTLSDSLESVRGVQQIQVSLLSHGRALGRSDDAGMRGDAESLERELAAVEGFIGTEQEGRLVGSLQTAVTEYLERAGRWGATPQTMDRLERALGISEQLVQLNLAQAEQARLAADRWSRVSNLGALGVTVLLVTGGAAAWWVVRWRILVPITHLSDALKRYGDGATDARAPDEGPIELREVAGQFNQMADALARQRDSQLAFLASIVHELRNPLQALSLATRMSGQVPPPVTRWELVSRQVGTLSRLVDDLLETSRIEAGHLTLRIDRAEIGALLREVTELFRASAPDRLIHLELPAGPVFADVDRVRLSQVFTNLISNALKYSPAGSPVFVSLREEAGAVIDVRDRGIGIPEEDRGQLFEPFRRGKNTRDVVPGVGLGLSVSRKIARALGGEITVSSTPGEGSTFTVHLPPTAGVVLVLTGPATASAP